MNRAAIVIFGAAVRPDGSASDTLRRRAAAAAAFGTELDRPLYVPTGAIGQYGASEASVMAGLLAGFGVAPEDILLEETATDTLSSARAVAVLLRHHGGPVYAASSAYHQPRCIALLRLAGVAARKTPPPPFPAATGLGKRWFWRMREVAAMPWDIAILAALRLFGRA